MRVLQVGLSYNRGGIESFVMNYYRQLAGEVQFDFICMYDSLAYEEEIKAMGGNVFHVPNVKKNPVGFSEAYKKILREGSYDAVHVNMLSAANVVPLRIARKCGVPKVICHSHNDRAPGFLRNFLHRLFRPLVVRYATDFWACSDDAARWMFSARIIRNRAYEKIYNAIPVEKYAFRQEDREKLREELGIEDCFVLGHVGRMEPQKNHKFLLEVFEKVAGTDRNARLLLVGDGYLKEELEESAKEKGLSDQVLFLGARSDIPELLSAMDVFCFPSLFEGLPLTLLEVQANGLPCVISDSISGEAVLAETVTGLSLESPAGEWSKFLSEKRWDRKMREASSRQGATCLSKAHFNIEKEAERLLALYGK